MSTGLIWFRDNLRLADNEPLVKAIEENETVLPVYVLDDAQDQQTKWGFPRSGNIRMQFLFETLSALQKNMRAIGGDLLVVQGNPVQVLPELVKKHSIKSVYAPASFSFNERQEEQDLQHKLDLKLYWSSSLIHPDDLPFDLEKLPDIFTQFRKKIEKYSAVRPTFDPPESISALAVNYDWQAPASTIASLMIEPFCHLPVARMRPQSDSNIIFGKRKIFPPTRKPAMVCWVRITAVNSVHGWRMAHFHLEQFIGN
jgi:deoxyribodipyrimidine photolyase